MKDAKKALQELGVTNYITLTNDKGISENFKSAFISKKFDGFLFLFDKLEISKALKVVSSVIEDYLTIENVKIGSGWIAFKSQKRKKKKLVFPMGDAHFDRNKDRYQYHTLLAALSFLKDRRVAIDIGGHIGLYSNALLEIFETVIGFEPAPVNAKCYGANASAAILHVCGLGAKEGKLNLNLASENSGNNSLVESFGNDYVPILIKTLDSFNINNIDLIKVDVQGFEEQVLLGAEQTLKNNSPIIIIELITHKTSPPNIAALNLLKSYGYEELMIVGKDYIMGKV